MNLVAVVAAAAVAVRAGGRSFARFSRAAAIALVVGDIEATAVEDQPCAAANEALDFPLSCCARIGAHCFGTLLERCGADGLENFERLSAGCAAIGIGWHSRAPGIVPLSLGMIIELLADFVYGSLLRVGCRGFEPLTSTV